VPDRRTIGAPMTTMLARRFTAATSLALFSLCTAYVSSGCDDDAGHESVDASTDGSALTST